MTSPDAAAFRRAVGRFTTGVTVVTSRAGTLDHAMTASAFTSVSIEPLLVLVCVEVDARFHDAVTDSGIWGVSVLPTGMRAAADWLATRGRPLHGQLDRIAHHRGPATGVALLDDALAALECRTTDVHPGGDHSIVVGEVVGVELGPPDAPPLVYQRSAYRHLA